MPATATARAEKERLNLLLGSHLATIHETLQVLDQTPPSSSSFDNKVTLEDVIQMAEQVSKQATTGTFNSFTFQFNLSLYLHVCHKLS